MAVTPKPIPSFASLQQSPVANPAQLLLAGVPRGPCPPPEDQLPALFNQLFNFGEKHGEDEEKGVNMDILVDENEDDALPPAQVSRPGISIGGETHPSPCPLSWHA